MRGRLLFILLALSTSVHAVPLKAEGQKFASYLTIIALLVTLPAFITLYIQMRKTNMGKALIQPMLAMILGFIAIMLNSFLDIYAVLSGAQVDNISMAMSVNRALSSVLMAVGCVFLFFSMKNKGLFSISYYQKKKHKKH